MDTIAREKPTHAMMNILSSDFCLLASQAAIQLDNLIRGTSAQLTAVKDVTHILKSSLAELGHPNKLSRVGFPGALMLVSHAMSDPSHFREITTLEELTQEVSVLLSDLDRASSTGGKEKTQLEKLREFCAGLSLAAASYLQGTYDSRPLHPCRR